MTTGLLTGLSDGRDVAGNQDRGAAGAWDDAVADFKEHPPALIVNATFQNLHSEDFAEQYPRMARLVDDYDLVGFVWRVGFYAPAESADR
jgi:hypothetical protein